MFNVISRTSRAAIVAVALGGLSLPGAVMAAERNGVKVVPAKTSESSKLKIKGTPYGIDSLGGDLAPVRGETCRKNPNQPVSKRNPKGGGNMGGGGTPA